jgi:TonB family protein
MSRFIPRIIAALLACTAPTDALYAAPSAPPARLLKLVKPTKSREASRRNLAGSGLFFLTVDLKTGLVGSVTIIKSTGHSELDQSAIEALKQWRFNAGAVSKVRLPVIFSPSDDVARF